MYRLYMPSFCSKFMVAALLFPLFARFALAKDNACLGAATLVEKEEGIPFGLLAAISKVESGDNPLAINVDGAADAPTDAWAAVAAVRVATANGAHFIDVGCFQVDLRWHPDAFPILADAFDPLRNAHIAARFLTSLRESATSWETAVARYHSAIAAKGADYARRVLARWRGSPTVSEDGNSARIGVRSVSRLFAFGIHVTGPGERAITALGLPVVVTP